ncbi:DUF3124 domain-containing protein [Crateriforma conspicua]|uniref:DUF3124 domain-containing protein n=1 Tax=Crateriforma conspicua TaxID=2527996 RepID=A0A5C5Y7S2_9PLAN|nr:DUF3124 domain-containing protein [Crateriforma conspicua]QDV62104.1 hypothetical protein Mal65_12320 [Crateriforma conspicua]TWT71727.1 hypothetical protein Pan14r_40430 [Crateriforma conspicua]
MSTESDSDKFVRFVKYLILLAIVIPLVIFWAFLELRFEALETEIQSLEPGGRDHARTELVELPWHPVQGQTLYVPAYSHVYHQDAKPRLLAVTLSVRNTDERNDIVVTRVDYFDSTGQRRRQLLEKPLRLAPLASTDFVIERKDTTGGSGASFIVQWTSGSLVNSPVVEAVMIDTDNMQGISFVRPARVLNESLDEATEMGND